VPERRQHVRVQGPFEGHWRGGSGATECRITDVSLGGCFVETVLQPGVGEETAVFIDFGSGHSITLAGKVVYAQYGVGFAVQFHELTAEQTTAMKDVLHLS
jgi:hypothetical protein